MAARLAFPLLLTTVLLLAAAALRTPAQPVFRTADACVSCHNNLVAPSGEDLSFGAAWQPTMMANSARDPYWQAAVRREVMDHPASQADIENECATCHMPMASVAARMQGDRAGMFEHLPVGAAATPAAILAADGVSCTVCHQIKADNLGTEASFTGGFEIEERLVFGPFAVDAGRRRIMQSATGLQPVEGLHIKESELCATCHTLFTHALGAGGEHLAEFPEQVPYHEWRHSAFRETRSCQSCHMPALRDETPIASTMGVPRPDVSRHDFRGGNFFMLGILNRFRDELGTTAPPEAMTKAIHRTVEHLQTESARIAIEHTEIRDGRLLADVVITNLAGHKLPTAYPSRRAWIHITVQDAGGTRIFESGALDPTGFIVGNDNDADARSAEPHHQIITHPDQVQIYEAIMADAGGDITTGLLSAVSYVKDNRLLPDGFDKQSAEEVIAVHGEARDDDDFVAGSDRTRYEIDMVDATPPFRITAELRYQPIAFRWARNLADYEAMETQRFVGYYEKMAHVSAVTLAATSARVEP